ncbi:MAG: TetR/AcrR family transcriptional regulator [Spirochaetales bacterium]|nr:TetR/AcrR family transcriptional regulator [Candidatus Physcosoma equi]
MDTRERILESALDLFSHRGYSGTSMNDIASTLGITKAALYKHYKGKQEILDSIVVKMVEMDGERAEEDGVPEEDKDVSSDGYDTVTLKNIEDFTLGQYDFWTKDSFASRFRRMLILEEYGDEKMMALYQKCLVSGPVDYSKDLFLSLQTRGEVKEGNPEAFATRLYSYLFLSLSLFDGGRDGKPILTELVKKFMEEVESVPVQEK